MVPGRKSCSASSHCRRHWHPHHIPPWRRRCRTIAPASRLCLCALQSLSVGIIVVRTLPHRRSSLELPGVPMCAYCLSSQRFILLYRRFDHPRGCFVHYLAVTSFLPWRILLLPASFCSRRILCSQVRVPVADALPPWVMRGFPPVGTLLPVFLGGCFAASVALVSADILTPSSCPCGGCFAITGFEGLPSGGYFATSVGGCPCRLLAWMLCHHRLASL